MSAPRSASTAGTRAPAPHCANSGFTITDWQGTLFGRVGRPNSLAGRVDEYHQFDNRVGTYVGLDVHYLDRVTLEGLHYDNHADPAIEDDITGHYAWETQFDTVGVRAETDAGWTAIVQWMGGKTYVAPEEFGLLRLGLRDPLCADLKAQRSKYPLARAMTTSR